MESKSATEYTKPGQVVRTNYLIYPRFQLALALGNLVVVMALFAITMLTLLSWLSDMKSLGEAAGLDSGHVYYQFLQTQSSVVFKKMLFALGVSLLLSTAFIIWLSHRVVGPLVGLIRSLQNIQELRANGQPLPPIRFRKNDFFHELAEGINEALDLEKAAQKRG